MNTAGDAINYVKADQRINGTEQDTNLLAWLNKNWVRRTRGRQYSQLLVEGTTFTTTSGTYRYNLPSDFWRLVPNSVQYDVSSTYAGRPLPDVNLQAAEAWRLQDQSSTPSVCIVVGAGTASPSKRLELLPSFTEGSKVVSYDYIAQATTFASTASTAQVPQLLEVVAYDTIADYLRYIKADQNEITDARQQAEVLYREANRANSLV